VLTSVEVTDFRCIERATLEFHERGTGIVGNNAAGKTSLLEAIYFLTHGRSFRTAARARLIRRGAEFFRVVARIQTEDTELVGGVEHGHGHTQTRLGGRGISGVSEIAQVLPIQVIDPGVHRLIDEGSVRRRRLLDWGVFHVKPEFLVTWRRYQRALEQRNAALRAELTQHVVAAWEQELSETAEAIDAARRDYVAHLSREFTALGSSLLEEEVELEYRRGWDAESTLPVCLHEARDKDRRLGTTTVGAHRADLVIRVDGVLARDRVSRGQQKVLAASLILGQIRALADLARQTQTCLLMDDPAAELDVDKLGKLLGAIARIPAQLIISSVTQTGLQGFEIGRLFHVEQGRFTRML
jgi:DNA replication and repair protein RecF